MLHRSSRRYLPDRPTRYDPWDDPVLAAAYRRCRELNRRHGRSYYLATRLLPAWKRPHVHALYGFTRYADEIVDRTDGLSTTERTRRLSAWRERFFAGLRGEPVTDPLLPAVLHTIARFRLNPEDFTVFLDSMAMDLTVTRYPDYPALLRYMEGSAAVIGTMLLPILAASDAATAREPARQLGFAFQLTNFIRDVAEDLDRGRIYLPQADLRRFDVTEAELRRAAERHRSEPRIRRLIRYEVHRAQAHYAVAATGIPILAASSQACVRAAYRLYGGILDEVKRNGYDVFAARAVVPNRRRLGMAARSLLTPAGTPVPIPAG